MKPQASALLQVILFLFCSAALAPAQQLRTEYREIRLSDKRVLTHARVESFDGISFCISHDAGVEGVIAWEIMPQDWKKAFPFDPQLKERLKLAASSRIIEQPAPGSMKGIPQRAVVDSNQTSQDDKEREARVEAFKRKAAVDRQIENHIVTPGMTAEQLEKAWGTNATVRKSVSADSTTTNYHYRDGSYASVTNGVVDYVATDGRPSTSPSPTPMKRSW